MKSKPLSPDLDKIEMLPDAWERFQKAVVVSARAKPMHRPVTRKPTSAEKKPSTKKR